MFQDYQPTQFERNWAMLAHLTALITVFVGFASGGAGAVAALLLPLGMCVFFRDRSPYVAFHALQATAFQAAAGIACVVIAIAAGVALAGAWLITGVLSLALIGLLLLPFAILLTVLVALGVVGVPLVMLAYTLRGAYLAYVGMPFEYPWIGALAARTMAAPAGAAA